MGRGSTHHACAQSCACVMCWPHRVGVSVCHLAFIFTLFRMASRKTAIIATSCSILPYEILAFTTSTFPSFYSSYILARFQVFTEQPHATQLTTLCEDERGYMSNTSSLLFSLPAIFVLDRLREKEGGGGGGGSDVFVWVFLKGHALIHSRKWEGHDFFRKKILDTSAHPSPQ